MSNGQASRTVALNEESIGGVSSGRDRALVWSIYADIVARLIMVTVIAVIFYWLNSEVMQFVRDAFAEDVKLLTAKIITPENRVVTNNVIVSLVGATVVQVGAAIVVIVSYLFPRR
jgi:multisubunit Na+/H+ antiporter MnhB subunit